MNEKKLKGAIDLPLTNPDNDRLEIKEHIKGLSKFICSCDTPMTIAIQGDWGTGKTTFINLIEDELVKRNTTRYNTICVQFNTWQFSQFHLGNDLPILLISALVSQLTKTLNDEKKQVVNKIHNGLSLLFQVGNEVVKNQIGADFSLLLKGEDNQNNVIDTIWGLKKDFQACVDAILEKEKKEKVVIFIDDLDRLEPKVAVEILEILKIFLDCNQCVFILAIDYQVVNIGVEQKYGDLFKDKEKSRNFFDKIIQVPYKMPVSLYKIDKYVEKSLEDMNFSKNNTEKYKNLISKSIGYNPRGMKRVFNAFLLLTYIYTDKNIENDENNQLLLFASLCLQLSYEEVYNYIISNKSQINSGWFNAILNDEEQEDTFLTELEKTSEAEENNDYTSVMEYLKVFIDAMKGTSKAVTEKHVIGLFDILEMASTTSSVVSSQQGAKTFSSNMLENIMGVIKDVRQNKNADKKISQKLSEAFKNVAKVRGIAPSSSSSAFTRGKLNLKNTAHVAVTMEELLTAFDNNTDFTQCELYKVIDCAYGEKNDLEAYFEEIKAL